MLENNADCSDVELSNMKRWYVSRYYAGYENIIKADLVKRIEEKGLQDKFGEILIPSAKMKQYFEADADIERSAFFPGLYAH